MWPDLLTVGNFHLSYFALVVFITLFFFSFFSWRKMRFDYDEEKIFTWTIYTILSMAAGGLVIYWAIYRQTGFWPVAAMIFGIYVLGKWARKQLWDFWEWLDWFGWWMLVSGGAAFLAWGPATWIYGTAYLLGGIGVSILGKNYRKFRWYKSGKPGFSGLAAIIWITLVEVMMTYIVTDSKFFIGVSLKQWLSAWILTASIVVLYLRGKTKI